jgi:hypothetical protein
MKLGIGRFASLVTVEWRRRQFGVFAATAFALVGWATALCAAPELRDGSSSDAILWCAASLFAAGLAASAFAPDVGEGRIEFLHANGAAPMAIFLAKMTVLLLAIACFSGLLHGVEETRLLFYHGDIRGSGNDRSPLLLLATNSREALVLYALPAVALLLFLSGLSSRTGGALAAGAAVFLGVLLLDETLSRHVEARDRFFLASAAWSLALVPIGAGLAALALWLRRIEPGRASVRVVLLGSAVVILGIRFLALETAGECAPSEPNEARTIVVSPDGRRLAIEGARAWHPSGAYSWAARAVGREPARDGVPFGSRVAIAGLDGSVSLVSDQATSLDRAAGREPWLTHRYLRVRGVDPNEENPSARRDRALLVDVNRNRLIAAPDATRAIAEASSQQYFALPPRPPRGEEVEVCRVAGGAVVYLGNGDIVLVSPDGERKRLWPAPGEIASARE